jgi:hypothetical protein
MILGAQTSIICHIFFITFVTCQVTNQIERVRFVAAASVVGGEKHNYFSIPLFNILEHLQLYASLPPE